MEAGGEEESGERQDSAYSLIDHLVVTISIENV